MMLARLFVVLCLIFIFLSAMSSHKPGRCATMTVWLKQNLNRHILYIGG